MITLGSKKDYEKIENYIEKNYYKCLYIYLNYKKYGFDNDNVKLYIQNDGQVITSIILTYYSGMHIYSKNYDYDIFELTNFIISKKPNIICAEKKIIENLSKLLLKYCYENEYGWVRGINSIVSQSRENIKKASIEDFKDIAHLLYSDDDIGSSYDIDELAFQIKERNLEGYGRKYIIKDQEKIIAHAGTGAENDKVAICNYLIVDSNYRKRGYATRILSAVFEDLISEGKLVYLINYTKESSVLYDKMGFKICCE